MPVVDDLHGSLCGTLRTGPGLLDVVPVDEHIHPRATDEATEEGLLEVRDDG